MPNPEREIEMLAESESKDRFGTLAGQARLQKGRAGVVW